MEGEESDRKMERGCGAILSGSMFVLRFRHNDTKSLFPKSSSRRTQNHHRFLIIRARCSNGKSSTSSSPSFVSLGIPSLDESYLPRCIGLGFVSLILLNHFLPSSNVTPAQLVHASCNLSSLSLTCIPTFPFFLFPEIRGFGYLLGCLLDFSSISREVSKGCDTSGLLIAA